MVLVVVGFNRITGIRDIVAALLGTVVRLFAVVVYGLLGILSVHNRFLVGQCWDYSLVDNFGHRDWGVAVCRNI